MDLAKLFETQKVLRDRIVYNEPDRFDKLILALLVEIGECANEWRGFKFWSKDQEPRTNVQWDYTLDDEPIYRNLLLEEYVDGLHFVLELGLEFGWEPVVCDLYLKAVNVGQQFICIFNRVNIFATFRTKDAYYSLVELYIGLGEMLGFTWSQIEQAYFEKNQINHERQNNGY
ncbi:dUTP diphosphatase [Cytobacillus solani]|uniref:dUTP diphosphatase n=1 Tax=Cytobacillus solani TaxID=1637975 RepID=UPI00207A8DA9|nr:dUTP diphosphatase [Cytobacillus solani]USK56543.1 dUTP diphosphatase [Cytobacillus solani]